MPDEAHFDQLLSQYFEGDLAGEQLAEFEARLLSEDGFAEHVALWCLMHRQIAELGTEHALHQLMDQFVKRTAGHTQDAFAQLESFADHDAVKTRRTLGSPSVGKSGRTRSLFRTWMYTAAAVTLSGLLLAPIGITLWKSDRADVNPGLRGPSTAATAPVPASNTQYAATLTELVDSEWAPGAPELKFGQQLSDGTRVVLKSGMAKVTFDCGAEVVLQAPCDFTVMNRMIGYLWSGRITANVPRRAFSFAILSRDVDFVDTGTAFGVSVGDDGLTELHVFEGEVLCGPSKDKHRERKDIIHVTANKALEFRAQQRIPTDIAMDEGQFSRLIGLRHAAKVPSTRVVSDQLALWLAADTAVKTDAKERVISWQDIIYGDNVSAEDALQSDENARPALVEQAINGQPAIRFDGNSDYLLTTPLETTDNQTVLFVCQFSPQAFDENRVWGGQIINYDGPPSRYLSDMMEPGVLQIGEPLLEEQFKPTLLTGQVFAGFIGEATVESGRVDAVQVGANVPVVVAYRYDFEHGTATLSINGRSYGQSRAFGPQNITSRKIIGRHAWMQLFFGGDLAEMLIYNKALSSQELADATSYLAAKYSISLEPEQDAKNQDQE